MKQGPSIRVVFFSIPGPDTIPFLVWCCRVWQSMPKIIIQKGMWKHESSSVPNELGREVPAFAPVDVVPSHGCEREARMRWARVLGGVREDLRLAGGRPFAGIVCRRGMQRSRRLPCGVHSGAKCAAPRLRAQLRRRRWMILSLQTPTFGRILPRSTGQQVSERDRARCQHRSKPRCQAVVALPCADLAPGLWNCVGPQRQGCRRETTLRPMIADEHVSCMEWPVCDSSMSSGRVHVGIHCVHQIAPLLRTRDTKVLLQCRLTKSLRASGSQPRGRRVGFVL